MDYAEQDGVIPVKTRVWMNTKLDRMVQMEVESEICTEQVEIIQMDMKSRMNTEKIALFVWRRKAEILLN